MRFQNLIMRQKSPRALHKALKGFVEDAELVKSSEPMLKQNVKEGIDFFLVEFDIVFSRIVDLFGKENGKEDNPLICTVKCYDSDICVEFFVDVRKILVTFICLVPKPKQVDILLSRYDTLQDALAKCQNYFKFSASEKTLNIKILNNDTSLNTLPNIRPTEDNLSLTLDKLDIHNETVIFFSIDYKRFNLQFLFFSNFSKKRLRI